MVITLQMKTHTAAMQIYDLASIGGLDHCFTESASRAVDFTVETKEDRRAMRFIMTYISDYLEVDDE